MLHCDLVCRHVIRYQRFRARLQRLGIEFSCANPDCGGFLFGLGRSLSNLGIVVSFHCYPPGFFSPYCWLCRGERGVKQQINKYCVGSHIEFFCWHSLPKCSLWVFENTGCKDGYLWPVISVTFSTTFATSSWKHFKGRTVGLMEIIFTVRGRFRILSNRKKSILACFTCTLVLYALFPLCLKRLKIYSLCQLTVVNLPHNPIFVTLQHQSVRLVADLFQDSNLFYFQYLYIY